MARAKVVIVTGAGGGVGTTAIAALLAGSIRRQIQGKVLLIDAGFPVPGMAASMVGVPRAKSLAEMAPLVGKFSASSLASYLTCANGDLHVLPLVSEVLQASKLSLEVITRVVELAHGAFEYLIVDTPIGVEQTSTFWTDAADYACIVVTPSAASIACARHVVQFLKTQQVPAEAMVTCVNQDSPDASSAAAVERSLGIPVAAAMPVDPTLHADAAAGRLINLLRREAGHIVDALAREIIRRRFRERRGTASVTANDSATADWKELKLRLHKRLVDEVELRKADLAYLQDPAKRQEMRVRVEGKIVALVQEEAAHLVERGQRRQLVKELLDESLGLGPLEDLLSDPAVTEIMVNHPSQVYVERNGRLELTSVDFLGNDQLRGIIERIVAPLGRRVDEKVPMVDARLPDGSRVNAIIPPVALKGPALTIRKFAKKLLGVEDLIKFGALTEQMATLLRAAVQARQNVVISGGTGSGKTTLLNLLSSYIPNHDRIVTIEDAAELQLPQEHVVALESRPANIEGEGAITIRDLVRNALRMRPDRIVVGECRAGEALDMLQAMNTGHDGSLTTIHSNSPIDALGRLETLSLMSGLDLPARAIRDQIASAINLIIQQTRLQDGSRRITYITEVRGQADGHFVTTDIFRFNQTGLSPDGRVLGQFMPTGQVPRFVESLPVKGIRVPREIFLHQTA